MSWIEIAWPMMGGASLALGLVHLFSWFHQRGQREALVFVVAAMAVAVLSLQELQAMRSPDPAEFAEIVRWGNLTLAVVMISLALFVRLRFNAGRVWILGIIIGMRTFLLVPNFLSGRNLHFREVHAMVPLDWLGVTVYAPVGTANPWAFAAQATSVLLLIYLVDAALQVRQRGDREQYLRARRVCLSVVAFLLGGVGAAALTTLGMVHLPFLVNLPFIAIVLIMSYELGLEVVSSAANARRLLHSQALLRESERRSELAVQAAGLATFSWRVGESRIDMNDQGLSLFGLPHAGPVDLGDLRACMDPADRARMEDVLVPQPGSLQFERDFRIRLADGSVRSVASRGEVQRDTAGNPVAVIGVALDVTRIRQADARFRSAVEATPTAILLVDPAGAVVLVNSQAAKLFGQSETDLVGRDLEDLLDPPLNSQHMRSAGARQPQGDGADQIHARRYDGGLVPVEVRVSPVEPAESALILVSIADISERLAADRESAQQRSELAHLSRVATIGEMSASLTHELNQPLTAILANSQAALRFLAAGPEHLAEVHETLVDIADNGRRAGEVIRRLRAMLKKGDPQHRRLELNHVVTEVMQLYRSELINRAVTVDLTLAPDLPIVLGDRIQLQQVLLNLVINACDAMDECGGERRLMIATQVDAGHHVVLSVRDSGGGLAEDRLEQVFEPFVTSKSEGMGLGLSVCRTITRRHGGRLWAENAPGGGAIFQLSLPGVAEEADGESEPA